MAIPSVCYLVLPGVCEVVVCGVSGACVVYGVPPVPYATTS